MKLNKNVFLIYPYRYKEENTNEYVVDCINPKIDMKFFFDCFCNLFIQYQIKCK